MSILFLLIPLSVLVASGFLCAFIWAVRSGQYEDTETPSLRVLMDEPGPAIRNSSAVEDQINDDPRNPS